MPLDETRRASRQGQEPRHRRDTDARTVSRRRSSRGSTPTASTCSSTPSRSASGRRTSQRDPRITVLIHSADDPWDWAEVRGHVVDTSAAKRRAITSTHSPGKYVGTDYRNPIGPQGRVILRIAADKVEHLRALTSTTPAATVDVRYVHRSWRRRSPSSPSPIGSCSAWSRRARRTVGRSCALARRRARRARVDGSAPDRLPIAGHAHRPRLHRGVR